MSGDQVTLIWWVYGLAGVLTLLVETLRPVRGWWRKRRSWPPQAPPGPDGGPPSWWLAAWRRACRFLAGCVAAAAVVVLWPVVPALAVKSWMSDQRAAKLRADKADRVRFQDLEERLNVGEVEARELIYDPMAGVPSVPFGHLNAGWLALKGTLRPGDELWSFTSPWRNAWGRPERRKGYVVWRRGQARGLLFTEIQAAPDWTASLPTRPAFDEVEIPAFLRWVRG